MGTGFASEPVLPAQRTSTPSGVVVGLESNLSTDGPLVDVAGMENLTFTGPALCFGSEKDCFETVKQRRFEEGVVCGIRDEGPRCGLGMRDGLPAATRGLQGGHLGPAAAAGGSIAHLRDDDIIDIEAVEGMLDLDYCDAEPSLRHAARARRHGGSGSGAIWNDAQGVGPARTGVVPHPGARGEISSYADI